MKAIKIICMSKEKLKEGINSALKNKDNLRLSVLRGLLSAYVNELVSKGRKPDTELTPDEELAVYKRQANQRKDSVQAFRSGNRPDLADKEEAELEIIKEFLPTEMTENEIKEIILKKKEELNIDDNKKMGILMGAVMKEIAGRADGNLVRKMIEDILNNS
ncbi:MAG TPA: GatB/YqeY domain-containing protein [Candidatus Vogelbacteria bacterium]|nr:GatB/YqeY domain-containing protein [Candidatus Vogelbacteria bacterium]